MFLFCSAVGGVGPDFLPPLVSGAPLHHTPHLRPARPPHMLLQEGGLPQIRRVRKSSLPLLISFVNTLFISYSHCQYKQIKNKTQKCCQLIMLLSYIYKPHNLYLLLCVSKIMNAMKYEVIPILYNQKYAVINYNFKLLKLQYSYFIDE